MGFSGGAGFDAGELAWLIVALSVSGCMVSPLSVGWDVYGRIPFGRIRLTEVLAQIQQKNGANSNRVTAALTIA